MINSIAQRIVFCKRSLYADDLQIYLDTERKNIDIALEKVNADANAIVEWSHENKINLNLRKTSVIIIGNKYNMRMLKVCGINFLNLCGQKILLSNTIKILGVFISSDLSWDIQVREITQKVNGALSRLRYRGDILSLEVRKILIQSLVFPLID